VSASSKLSTFSKPPWNVNHPIVHFQDRGYMPKQIVPNIMNKCAKQQGKCWVEAFHVAFHVVNVATALGCHFNSMAHFHQDLLARYVSQAIFMPPSQALFFVTRRVRIWSCQ
jgi:hypothetical protein